MKTGSRLFILFLLPFAFVVGCGDDVGNTESDGSTDGIEVNPNEVMTTVKLTLTPTSGGESFVVTWADPENDGSPVIDDMTLTNGETYTVSVEFLNELVDPTVNVTPEIMDEMDEHQVFFTGTAVEGPCNTANPDAVVEHAYGDTDSNEFPIGLMNTFTAKASGTGVLSVLLRHMPPINGEAVKTGTLANVIDSGSSTDLPGSTDIDIEFTVTVE